MNLIKNVLNAVLSTLFESGSVKMAMKHAKYIGKDIIFLAKSIDLGKEQFGLPDKEEHIDTNLIR